MSIYIVAVLLYVHTDTHIHNRHTHTSVYEYIIVTCIHLYMYTCGLFVFIVTASSHIPIVPCVYVYICTKMYNYMCRNNGACTYAYVIVIWVHRHHMYTPLHHHCMYTSLYVHMCVYV